ncbi:MAG: hypothetical protein CEE43_07965 [Promethearchaeota archaeon Loki_b32]|nr:MAG: hypothetical protein CEE43_07965 [Candidatus Lokiarchaeota archaeon Loki_b32]
MQIDNFNLYLSLAPIIIFCPHLFCLIAELLFGYLLTFSIENQGFYNHFGFLKNKTQWNNDN